MRVALHDSDATRFPNLALMKLSAWHKATGDEVYWFDALQKAEFRSRTWEDYAQAHGVAAA